MNNLKPIRSQTRRVASMAASLGFSLLLMGANAFAAPPANDDFANAIVIPASPPATVTGNNTDATYESGEPLSSVEVPPLDAGTNTVWWIWTPNTTGPVTIDTINSSFDTELAVYTGGAVNALTPVVRNDDDPGLQGGRSRVTVSTAAGTTYHIAVAGYQNIAGTVNLNFSTGTTNPPTGLTLAVSVTGSGSVTKSPNKASYDTNETVTLTASPSGTNFLGWGGDAAAFGLTNPISLTMNGNKTVTANFTTNANTGPFTLSIDKEPSSSSGTVTKIPNKTRYDAGEVVTVVASARGSRTFLGWTGTDEGNTERTNTVTMNEDKAITATFSGVPGPTPSPYLEVVGTYSGLFYETNLLTSDCAGSFTIKVAKSGKFTGKFKSGGKTYSARGLIDANGDATATIGKGTDTASLQFHVDLSGASDEITGTVTTPDCVAQLLGDRQVFSSRNPAPLVGTYTIVFPRNATDEVSFDTNGVPIGTNTVVANQGHGYAVLTISKSGRARIRGALADGAKINQSTFVSKNGQVPLHVSLYRGQGHLIGWLDVSGSGVTGTVNWQRPEGGLVFPEGLNVDIDVIGSRFDRSQNPLVNLSNPILEIGGNSFVANGEQPLLIGLEGGSRNTFVGTGANENHVSLKVLSSGLVRGKFISPVTLKSTKLQGVVLQNGNALYGYYLGTGARGYFQVVPSAATGAE